MQTIYSPQKYKISPNIFVLFPALSIYLARLWTHSIASYVSIYRSATASHEQRSICYSYVVIAVHDTVHLCLWLLWTSESVWDCLDCLFFWAILNPKTFFLNSRSTYKDVKWMKKFLVWVISILSDERLLLCLFTMIRDNSKIVHVLMRRRS